MKKNILLSLLTATLVIVLSSFLMRPAGETVSGVDAKEVLKTHCYGCHTDASSGKISKTKLNFDKWNDYNIAKKISKLEKICEEVEEGKMPPKKFLKSNPGKALSDEQKQLICKWAEAESEKLMESMQ